MSDDLLTKIQELEAEIASLNERVPSVDKASRRRDRRQVYSGLSLFAVAVLMAGTMGASALTGTNTVDSGDIKDGTITSSDIKAEAILGSRVRDGSIKSVDVQDNSLTGADINESTLVLPPGPKGDKGDKGDPGDAGASLVRDRIRFSGSLALTEDTAVSVPITGGDFTQAAGESLGAFGEMKVTLNCPSDEFSEVGVRIVLYNNGVQFTSVSGIFNRQNSGQQAYIFGEGLRLFLLESGVANNLDLTATATVDQCSSATLNSVRVNIFGVS